MQKKSGWAAYRTCETYWKQIKIVAICVLPATSIATPSDICSTPEPFFSEGTGSRQAYLNTDLHRAEAWQQLLEDARLIALAPLGGLQTTFIPYNADAARVLDNTFTSNSMCNSSWICEVIDVALPTHHRLLTALLGCNAVQRRSRRRHRYMRRKWKDWGEASPGQFAALLRHGAWTAIQGAEKNISQAGGTSAKRMTQRRWTPFDDCILQLEAQRNSTACRQHRTLLTRCVFAARRFRQRWKYDEEFQTATERGSNFSKQAQTRQGLELVGAGEQTTRQREFEEHWKKIMIGEGETAAQILLPRQAGAEAEGAPDSEGVCGRAERP